MTLQSLVVSVLRAVGISHALIGGVALNVHGVNRATLDLDHLVVDPSCLQSDLWADLGLQGSPSRSAKAI